MSTYGFQSVEKVGRSIQLTADGAPIAKAGGVTIDWATVSAATAERTFEDGDVVSVGDKFLRYGQVVCRITATGKYGPYDAAASDGRQLVQKGNCYVLNESMREKEAHSDHPPVIDGGRVWKRRLLVVGAGAGAGALGGNEVQTVTIDATGGTFTLTYAGQTTAAIAYNATAAAVVAALEALSNIGVGDVAVTKTGSVFTITFQGALENTNVATLTASGASLTGGAATATVAVANEGTSSPTLAAFEAAFPMITYVPEN